MDTKNINWWKVAGIILLLLNVGLIVSHVVENEKQVKTHIGEMDREVYDYVQNVLLNDYEYVSIYNTETGQAELMRGLYKGAVPNGYNETHFRTTGETIPNAN